MLFYTFFRSRSAEVSLSCHKTQLAAMPTSKLNFETYVASSHTDYNAEDETSSSDTYDMGTCSVDGDSLAYEGI